MIDSHNCLYLPAHTSHGLQALDNAPFAALKRAFEAEVETLNSFTDGSPVGKLNFIKCLKIARTAVSSRTIQRGFSHTGTWPISRTKALQHPEIGEDSDIQPQPDEDEALVEPIQAGSEAEEDLIDRAYVIGLAKPQDRQQRIAARKVANELDDLRARNALLERENAGLKVRIKELTKTKKKRPVPNPNKRFMSFGEINRAGGTIEDLEEEVPARKRRKTAVVAVVEPEVVVENEAGSSAGEEDEGDYTIPAEIRTRSGRTARRSRRFDD